MLALAGAPASVFGPQSPEARAIAALMAQTFGVCAVIFAIVAVLVGYAVIKFRARAGAPEPKQTHGNTRLEVAWTIAPLLVVIWLFVLTTKTMGATDPPANRPADVVVIGHQWWWEARYASGAVTANEIHMPTGTPWLVEILSDDVIHDFWVPQLGRKMDATPGHPVDVWMQADTAGTYLGACAEYCGAQHAWMRIAVVAEAPADFAAWQAHERAPAPNPAADSPAARGRALFTGKTCADCHAIADASGAALPRVAPDLTHLAERHTLAAGLLDNTPDNLGKWLKAPQDIKPGSHMPSLQLTDAQVADLVAYFETLR